MNNAFYTITPNRDGRMNRDQFLGMLSAAEAAGSFRFGRQASLAWLAIFPGDLEVQLWQARFLLDEGKIGQAIPLLEGLIRRDPEFLGASSKLAEALSGLDEQRKRHLNWMVHALGGEANIDSDPPGWAQILREVRSLIGRKLWVDAQALLQPLLGQDENNCLVEITHLRLASQLYDAQAFQTLAELYHERRPDCLVFSLYLADAWMDMGEDQEAVKLLHESMTQDSAGQVSQRLWGGANPYRSLWPDSLSIVFDMPIPADVASKLGWNVLPVGDSRPLEIQPTDEICPQKVVELNGVMPGVQIVEEPQPLTEEKKVEDAKMGVVPGQTPVTAPIHTLSEDLVDIEAEFKELAQRLKKPGISKTDGRFPNYVIFSTQRGLETQYGPETAAILITEMKRLAEAVRKRTGWAVTVFLPDKAECAALAGIEPVAELDPWKLKLTLADLDKALRKKGEMIGALLIVGGPVVVPFHALPNPADDYDEKVLSDNPYATTDANYFVPAWPVGRLPGEAGADAGLLLEHLRLLIANHTQGARYKSLTAGGLLIPLLEAVQTILRAVSPRREVPNSGYSAQVWRRSSTAVFRPVGNPSSLLISPPETKESVEVEKLLHPQLGYYNLHGLEDGAEWYGQRDPGEGEAGADYPVALSPKDLKKNGHSPRIIFSEACYGGNVVNKTEDDALCLKFLALGSLAVVGSTAIAYGAMSTPLIAADLLGNYFWQQIKAGKSVGEALMVAKIELAREMVHRQGCLDAEDQKTLLSFVLYGDPLVGLDSGQKLSKVSLRLKRPFILKVAQEQPLPGAINTVFAKQAIAQVKEHLQDYLPGMDTAAVHFSHQVLVGRAGDAKNKKSVEGQERLVVTFSKQVPTLKQVHRHYARATVDTEGKLVKLAVSR